MRALIVPFKYAALIAIAFALAGCGGRMISRSAARKLIVDLPGGAFNDKDVQIEEVSQVGASEAVVETSLRSAFRLQKVNGEWVVREVRIGQGEWASLDDMVAALQTVRISATRSMMGSIVAGIQKYWAQHGGLPEFNDYISLSDALSPTYMTPLIRLDAWNQPFVAYKLSPDTVRIESAGPDGKLATNDDMELTRRFP